MTNIKIPRAYEIAKLSFVLLIFFSFYSTSLPFQTRAESVEDVATSNIINVLLYPSLFLLSLIASLNKIDEVLQFIWKEKFLFIFLVWALLSILWSNFPMVSFKRWFQVFDYYFVFVVFLVFAKDKRDIFNSIKPILYSYVILSIVSVFLVPGAIDEDFGTWRGLASSKNNLGHISIACIITSGVIFFHAEHKLERIAASIFLLLSTALLLGSFSSTAYITFFFFSITALVIYITKEYFRPIGVGNFVLIMLWLSIMVSALTIGYLNPEIADVITSLFGKDTSFSDRTYLWEYIIMQISKHPIIGSGFQGFWVIDSPQLEMLYTIFVWFPFQAHNGYLDLINELGLIGFFILLAILLRYFLVSQKNKILHFSAWFIVCSLVINFTETTLFRPGYLIHVLFMLAYLFLFFQFNNSEVKFRRTARPNRWRSKIRY